MRRRLPPSLSETRRAINKQRSAPHIYPLYRRPPIKTARPYHAGWLDAFLGKPAGDGPPLYQTGYDDCDALDPASRYVAFLSHIKNGNINVTD